MRWQLMIQRSLYNGTPQDLTMPQRLLALETALLARQCKPSLTILRQVEEQIYTDKTRYLYSEPTMISDSARIISPDGIRKFLFHHLSPLYQSSHVFLLLSFK